MILHLVRHGPPEILPGICYGQLDVPARDLLPTAAQLREVLPPALPVWTSPLRRCRELAELLHPAPTVDVRLMEMDFGQWEGRAWDDVPRAELDAWAADIEGYAPPGGESAHRVRARVLEFLAALTVPEAVLVTHAGVIRMLWGLHHGLAAEAWLAHACPYASVTCLDWDATPRPFSAGLAAGKR